MNHIILLQYESLFDIMFNIIFIMILASYEKRLLGDGSSGTLTRVFVFSGV